MNRHAEHVQTDKQIRSAFCIRVITCPCPLLFAPSFSLAAFATSLCSVRSPPLSVPLTNACLHRPRLRTASESLCRPLPPSSPHTPSSIRPFHIGMPHLRKGQNRAMNTLPLSISLQRHPIAHRQRYHRCSAPCHESLLQRGYAHAAHL